MDTQGEKVRIVVVDAHPVQREQLKRLVESQNDMEIAAEAGDPDAAIAEVKRHRPDVLVVSVSLPGSDGAQAARAVQTAAPGVPVVALSEREDLMSLESLVVEGAQGNLLKRGAPDELAFAIRAVHAGRKYIGRRLRSKLPPAAAAALAASLSERETAVLQGIARGFSNKEIACQFDISVKSVETYKARAMAKLDLHSRVDIVRYAQLRGWYRPEGMAR